jgi:hypothetical protein
MPKKSKKIIKSGEKQQEEEEPQPIYFKSKLNKVQTARIEQLKQDFLKNNEIEFNFYK